MTEALRPGRKPITLRNRLEPPGARSQKASTDVSMPRETSSLSMNRAIALAPGVPDTRGPMATQRAVAARARSPRSAAGSRGGVADTERASGCRPQEHSSSSAVASTVLVAADAEDSEDAIEFLV